MASRCAHASDNDLSKLLASGLASFTDIGLASYMDIGLASYMDIGLTSGLAPYADIGHFFTYFDSGLDT